MRVICAAAASYRALEIRPTYRRSCERGSLEKTISRRICQVERIVAPSVEDDTLGTRRGFAVGSFASGVPHCRAGDAGAASGKEGTGSTARASSSTAGTSNRIGRCPMIAVKAKSGLRVTRWASCGRARFDVHYQRLVIAEAQTDAGVREVDLSLDVMDERANRSRSRADEFVFATDSGRPRDKDNVRERVLWSAVNRTNDLRAKWDLPPFPPVSPHTLRAASRMPRRSAKPIDSGRASQLACSIRIEHAGAWHRGVGRRGGQRRP